MDHPGHDQAAWGANKGRLVMKQATNDWASLILLYIMSIVKGSIGEGYHSVIGLDMEVAIACERDILECDEEVGKVATKSVTPGMAWRNTHHIWCHS